MHDSQLDAVGLYHFMNWRLHCYDADGNAFEDLVEEALQRLHPDRFSRVRPYGSLGDRKTDGLLYSDGVAYQVYSPNTLKMTRLKRKIRNDLAGAVDFWGEDLDRWVFVFNARRGSPGGGVPADVYKLLSNKNDEYDGVEVEPLSDDMLWEQVRNLAPQKRNEFLSAPPEGWEGIFVPPVDVPDEEMDGLGKSRVVVIHDMLAPADRETVLEALAPEQPFGPPLHLTPDLEELRWEDAAVRQARELGDVINKAAPHLSRFAVFPLSPIPLLVHLGFLLSDTRDVDLYQYHRDANSWSWSDAPESSDGSLSVEGIPDDVIQDETEVAIRVSVSQTVQSSTTTEAVGELPVEVDVRVDEPSRTDWLTEPKQVRNYRRAIRELLDVLVAKVPHCTRIHLFLAVPAPLAVATGQSINPRMTPPFQLYEYDHPSYEPVLTLPR